MPTGPTLPDPYKGLVPYTEDDAQFFFGRDAERQTISANLYAAPLTVLYGASGVGKSSVLQAGVAFHLRRQAGRAVVVFNDWHADPLAELKQAIGSELTRVAPQEFVLPDLPLDEYLQGWETSLPGPLMIILDQFEEYLLNHSLDDDPNSMDAELARAVNGSNHRVSFLLSLREDALSWLDRFQRRIPGLFDNYLRLEPLSADSARDAITLPLEVYNQDPRVAPAEHVRIEPELVQAIIEQVARVHERGGPPTLAPGLRVPNGAVSVEAPYLQLVMERLWQERKRGTGVLRRDLLESLGGVKKIVQTHLDAKMELLARGEREVAANIFGYLVTPSGLKMAFTARDLAGFAEFPPARVQPVVNRLSGPDFRVLRPIAPPATAAAESRFEIFHDALAEAVLDWRSRYFGRSERQRNLVRASLVSLSALGVVALAPLTLPPVLLSFARGLFLVVVNTLALQQVFRWFYQTVRSRVTLLAAGLGGPNLGILLGVLLTALWLAVTNWSSQPDSCISLLSQPDALGGIGWTQSVQYLFVVMPTLLIGFMAFLFMRIVGEATDRLLKRFSVGFYGAYFVACALTAALILLALLNPEVFGCQIRF